MHIDILPDIHFYAPWLDIARELLSEPAGEDVGPSEDGGEHIPRVMDRRYDVVFLEYPRQEQTRVDLLMSGRKDHLFSSSEMKQMVDSVGDPVRREDGFQKLVDAQLTFSMKEGTLNTLYDMIKELRCPVYCMDDLGASQRGLAKVMKDGATDDTAEKLLDELLHRREGRWEAFIRSRMKEVATVLEEDDTQCTTSGEMDDDSVRALVVCGAAHVRGMEGRFATWCQGVSVLGADRFKRDLMDGVLSSGSFTASLGTFVTAGQDADMVSRTIRDLYKAVDTDGDQFTATRRVVAGSLLGDLMQKHKDPILFLDEKISPDMGILMHVGLTHAGKGSDDITLAGYVQVDGGAPIAMEAGRTFSPGRLTRGVHTFTVGLGVSVPGPTTKGLPQMRMDIKVDVKDPMFSLMLDLPKLSPKKATFDKVIAEVKAGRAKWGYLKNVPM